jgi:hypothetical protein
MKRLLYGAFLVPRVAFTGGERRALTAYPMLLLLMSESGGE